MRVDACLARAAALTAVLLLVAACETPRQDTGAAVGEGTSQTTAPSGQPGTAADATRQGLGTRDVQRATASQIRPGSQEDLSRSVGDTVFFATDRSDLSSEARAAVVRWAEWLKQYPSVNVTVAGHADERGTRDYNLALGDRRASAVKSFLIALGTAPSRVETISYGKERPTCVQHDETCWQQNRRGVLLVN